MNTFPIVFMSRFLGPDLKERMTKNNNKSAIINMTSYYVNYPNEKYPIYSASK
jgi:short-subunit dehydrogenase